MSSQAESTAGTVPARLQNLYHKSENEKSALQDKCLALEERCTALEPSGNEYTAQVLRYPVLIAQLADQKMQLEAFRNRNARVRELSEANEEKDARIEALEARNRELET
ncbi:uncharacterized protein K452DRAFT_301716 [Aplosporella prunicola CBS 121167]|uniref:Uncharacterized protein n=1 Tax=Aplosporella prunicola CBS 121167 TaxID=1176127 RepID=A0A6A6B4R2_9PEZI|nr:uncharacterized protein K452DRAFT_301716 [Aplosporella prunicola CBS 121167]KAF2137741.1 hypothetical protein K452DRAFT_301716 [Aplosporella prunicola CBS 121167]